MARVLSNWITSYITHMRHSEAPTIFHFWSAVSTIGGALRRRVWIDQRHFQWTPNFYIILVGPPGVATKSTSSRVALSLLGKVPGVTMGPSSTTWQALTTALGVGSETMQIDGLQYPMSCITCHVSELGTFLNPSDREMVNVMVDLWDGQKGPWNRWTKSSGNVNIINPWINVIGCTTPSWITENIPEGMIGGGFMSRVVFVFGDTKKQLVAYPSRRIDETEWAAEEAELITDLKSMGKLKGPYKLDDEAYTWGEQWYERLWDTRKRSEHLTDEKFQGYIARKQGHVHKLSMVLAASTRDELILHTHDLAHADEFMVEVERDMSRVFAAIGAAPHAKHLRTIGAFLSISDLTKTELWRRCLNSITPEDFDRALKAGRDAGVLRTETRGGQMYYKGVRKQ